MRMLARRVSEAFLDAIWPPACPVCQRPLETAQRLCASCTTQLAPLQARCERCSYPIPCHSCANLPTPLTALIAATEYTRARELVFAYKYGRIRSVGRFLADMLAETVRQNPYGQSADVIAAVPLHRVRERERAFNQSDLLATAVAAALGKPLASTALVRTRATPRQATIQSRAERMANVRGAFHVKDPRAICGKTVLLVDDVITTGATVCALAETVLEAGALAVSAAAVAHPFASGPMETYDSQIWTV